MDDLHYPRRAEIPETRDPLVGLQCFSGKAPALPRSQRRRPLIKDNCPPPLISKAKDPLCKTCRYTVTNFSKCWKLEFGCRVDQIQIATLLEPGEK